MDDGRTGFVVFGLGDPHSLEGGEGRKNRTTNPDGVSSLGGSNDLDLHGRGSKGGDFLGESFGNTGEHGSTTREDDVVVEILSDIDITLHDRVEGKFVDTGEFLTDEGRLEEEFRASESLILDGNGVTIG